MHRDDLSLSAGLSVSNARVCVLVPALRFAIVCIQAAKNGLRKLSDRFIVLALPIFPGRRQPSIVGAGELNCRVRNGNGWTLTAINTNYSSIPTGTPVKIPSYYSTLTASCQETFGDPYRIRTDVKGVRGLCLNHLTNGPFRCSYPLSAHQ